jgi:hypothetical protein
MPSSLEPGVSSTYFRPRADRWRTKIVVSAGSGSTALSSFMLMIATASLSRSAVSRVAGVMSSTRPTRKPPIRTSLPFTRFEPDGSSALTS